VSRRPRLGLHWEDGISPQVLLALRPLKAISRNSAWLMTPPLSDHRAYAVATRLETRWCRTPRR